MVIVIALGVANSRAQISPTTPPNKIWAPVDESNSWFADGNWSPNGIPLATDDVGIGIGGPAEIVGGPPATARTVTLGVESTPGIVNGIGRYSPGELDVGDEGVLDITPIGTANPGLQVLSGSTLQIQDFGLVNLGSFTVDNFGQINIGTNGNGGTLIAGKVVNEKSGSIAGGLTFETQSGGTVVNAGAISGLVFSGVTVGNGISMDNGPGNIINSGTISGANGIDLADGGSVTNNAGGKITGTADGILSSLPFSGSTDEAKAAVPAPAVTITNSGTISGATGVEADAGGEVTNETGGVIQGTNGEGIIAALPESGVAPAPLTVVNSGKISGSGAGIDLEGGGSIRNNPGGSIVSGAGSPAILSNGGPLAFSNAGTINGSVILANFANQASLVTGGVIFGDLNLGTNTGTTLTLDGAGSQALSQAVTGLITNSGSLIKQGSGTWVVDKSLGNYAGGTTISAGTLSDALTNALGTGGVTVTGNTSLLHVNQGVTITNAILLTAGGSIDNAGRVADPLQGCWAVLGAGT